MSESTRRRELGRGERVLPGAWRLRLPLPWPGVPHCNAWALAAGDGIVLVDCGLHEEGSIEQLERAMGQVGLRLADVRLLVCTHAHSDHYGQAATVIESSGCELWMHPNHAHMTAAAEDPDEALSRRLEVARMSGVPVAPLAEWAEAAKQRGYGIAGIVEPDRDLLPGVVVETDLGAWTIHETPGHAPSHVCLHQAERRILISGDHLLGRVSLYFDYGWTPDPVGEFLASLDKVQRLDARLCLAGHGRTFTDVSAHIDASGCELWMHPDHAHMTAAAEDPDEALARRMEVARTSGVPAAALARYAERARELPSGIARVIEPNRALVGGVEVETDLGAWTIHE
ncbi:MAG TPA: MBL fold metallo-hydrolase, partial [Solirubrobacteraceae bacterium]|nr:MBL fold metallo-hydrolase [Solirubrobacteraceae bacterium]